MKRNPLNTNQQIHNEPFFHGSPVMTSHGYLIVNHLQRIHDCLYRSLERHNRICVMRCDLYVPSHVSAGLLVSNAVITKAAMP